MGAIAGRLDHRHRQHRDGSSRSGRASGKSSRSRAARSRPVSCGRRARALGVCVVRVERRADRRRRLHRRPASPNIAEVAPGKRHSIPSVAECRSCHDSARTEILGFNALQLSTDRDPQALHAEPLSPDMVTLAHARRREPDRAAAYGLRDRAAAHRRGNPAGANGARLSVDQLRQLPQPGQLDRVGRLISQTRCRWGQTFLVRRSARREGGRFVRRCRMRSRARHHRGTQGPLGRAVQSRREPAPCPGNPVTHIRPPMPCATWSNPARSRYGPSWPKPEMLA